MSNKREIEPSLDYFELRRRHEEYKNSQRQKDAPEAPSEPQAETVSQAATIAQEASTPQEVSAPVVQSTPAAQEAPAESPAAEVSATEVPGPEPEDVSSELKLSDDPDTWRAPSDDRDMEDAALLDDDLPDDEAQEGEEAADVNPNPFDPFIHAFKGIRSKLSGRFGRRRQEEEYEDDASPEDDEEDGDRIDEAPAPQSDSAPENAPESNAAQEAPREDAPVEDVLDDAPTGQVTPGAVKDDDPGDDDPGDDDPDDEIEDYEDDEYEDEAPDKVSRFKKFMRLFVVRIDDDEESGDDAPDDAEYEEEDDGSAPADDAAVNVTPGAATTHEAPTVGVGLRDEEAAWAAPAVQDNEGGPDMSDLNNVNTELTDALAAALETSGMTRRERRELAQRLAAERPPPKRRRRPPRPQLAPARLLRSLWKMLAKPPLRRMPSRTCRRAS